MHVLRSPTHAKKRSGPSRKTGTALLTPTRPSEAVLSHAFLELAPDAIVVADVAGRIVLVNHQTETIFGYPRADLLGREVEQLLPGRFQQIHHQHRAEFAVEPHTRPMGIGLELWGRRHDGSEFPVEVSLSPFQMGEDLLIIAIVRDITERRALEQLAQANVQARLRLLQSVLDTLPVSVYLVRGNEARLVLANRAVETVWGAAWTQDEPLEAFLAANRIQVYDARGVPMQFADLATMRAVRDGQTCLQQEETVRRSDGTRLPIMVSAFPLDPELVLAQVRSAPPPGVASPGRSPRAGAGRRGRQTIAQTIGQTAGGRRQPSLAPVESVALVVQEDVSSIKDAERLKDEFITLAAHELRNPMASILGFAQMLQPRADAPADAAPLADWQQEAIESMLQSTRRLVVLTDDLLDATRLQAGRLELAFEPSDLVALARRVIRRMQPSTASHAIELIAPDPEAQEYIVVQIDAGRIEQVLSNLLHNAIKYSPDGGAITVTVTADHERLTAQLAVRDHGIGIPQQERTRLFGRFARTENARERGIDGTGLGLFLCRELVERHRGRIWFESVEGQGSTFFLTLPMVSPALVDGG